MKHVFSVLSVAVVMLLTVFITSTGCKKGDTGPKGDTGNANVMYSPWLSVKYSMTIPQPNDTVYIATINAPQITDSVISKGDVRIYVNTNTSASPEIMSLPYSTFIIPFISKGKIELDAVDDFSTFTQSGATYLQYRYVIIQGSSQIPGRLAVNLNDYNSVKQYYKIPD